METIPEKLIEFVCLKSILKKLKKNYLFYFKLIIF